MRFAVLGDHRRFFEENGYVEFENLIDVPDKPLSEGRDLWRTDPKVKAISCSRRLAEVASELTGQRPLRLAYDQLPPPSSGTLQELSSVQGFLVGLLLRLSEDGEEEPPFSEKRGSGSYISDELLLKSSGQGQFLLVVYAGEPAVYRENRRDSLGHLWKKRGIGYGDRLRDPGFPTLVR